MTENDLSSQVTVSQTLTALELRSLLTQLETAVWEQITASHMASKETVVNALVKIIMQNFICSWRETLDSLGLGV